MAEARDARSEAQALLEPHLQARVLEPSPPADADPQWFARDEASPGADSPDAVVTPTSAGSTTWDDLAGTSETIAPFARDRWLGNWRRLGPVPDGFAPVRTDLHRLAFYVMSAARHSVNGKIGLRWCKDGFGTPFFGPDVQVRLEGTELVVQAAGSVHCAALSSLSEAATLVGVPLDGDRGQGFDVPELDDPDRPLAVESHHVAFAADWFGFVTSVLEELRVGVGPGAAPSRVQLWPEHFDVATEIAAADGSQRAGFGGSPGDAAHPEPYVYVTPWAGIERSTAFWNEEAFDGASVGHADLLAAGGQRQAALDFFAEGLRILGLDL